MINYYIYNQKKYLQVIRHKADFLKGGGVPYQQTVDSVKKWWQQQNDKTLDT